MVEVVVLEHHDHTLLKTVLDVARRVPHVAFAALPEHLAHRLLHLILISQGLITAQIRDASTHAVRRSGSTIMATAIMLQMHSRVTAVDVPEVCGSLASLAASSNYQLGEHMGWPAAKTSIETSTNWSLDQAPVAGGSHDTSRERELENLSRVQGRASAPPRYAHARLPALTRPTTLPIRQTMGLPRRDQAG